MWVFTDTEKLVNVAKADAIYFTTLESRHMVHWTRPPCVVAEFLTRVQWLSDLVIVQIARVETKQEGRALLDKIWLALSEGKKCFDAISVVREFRHQKELKGLEP
jgi:hypothetical protein